MAKADNRTRLDLGISAEEEEAMGADIANRLRSFRLVIVVANALRAVMDRRLSRDGLTTQQAALLTVARSRGAPSFKECAAAIGTSHQNVKQLALALERKGFMRIVPDAEDRRVRRLVTTKKNDSYWAERDDGDHEVVLRAFANLSPADARELVRLLSELKTGADTMR